MKNLSHKSSSQEDWYEDQSKAYHIKSTEARNHNRIKKQEIHLHMTGSKITIYPSRVMNKFFIMKKRSHREWHQTRNRPHEQNAAVKGHISHDHTDFYMNKDMGKHGGLGDNLVKAE